ncbi:hypothetical protein [Cupriavidus basilensis]|uniref:hypothetical protein n=1 Tax=Cupriavidus basilensis TaxID=68895 RepID=UPI0039F69F55
MHGREARRCAAGADCDISTKCVRASCFAIENGDPAAPEEAVLTLIKRAEKDFEDRAAQNRTANDQPV